MGQSSTTGIVEKDLKAFTEKIFSPDPLTMVVKAHLYIESALVALIQVYMEHDVLETDRLSFRSKVQLCIGLGLLDASEENVLNSLNLIRNRFVHNLDVKLERKDAYKLMNALKVEERQQVNASLNVLGIKESTHMETIAVVFIVLYAKLISLARGLELLRKEGLTKDEIIKRLREIKP